MKISQR